MTEPEPREKRYIAERNEDTMRQFENGIRTRKLTDTTQSITGFPRAFSATFFKYVSIIAVTRSGVNTCSLSPHKTYSRTHVHMVNMKACDKI